MGQTMTNLLVVIATHGRMEVAKACQIANATRFVSLDAAKGEGKEAIHVQLAEKARRTMCY